MLEKYYHQTSVKKNIIKIYFFILEIYLINLVNADNTRFTILFF